MARLTSGGRRNLTTGSPRRSAMAVGRSCPRTGTSTPHSRCSMLRAPAGACHVRACHSRTDFVVCHFDSLVRLHPMSRAAFRSPIMRRSPTTRQSTGTTHKSLVAPAMDMDTPREERCPLLIRSPIRSHSPTSRLSTGTTHKSQVAPVMDMDTPWEERCPRPALRPDQCSTYGRARTRCRVLHWPR